jgi:hypothetical protein
MPEMQDVKFDRRLLDGASGRNGVAETSAVRISCDFRTNRLQIIPLKTNGSELANTFTHVPMSNAGDLIKAIAEVAVSHSPHLKEKLASDLRAALIALEFAAPEPDSENIARYPHG